MPCDRDFTRIEIKKRKQDTVYTPDQWVSIIKESACNISVVDVEQSMIKDFKTLFSSLKDPVPLFRNQQKWKVTTYKIIQYQNSLLTVSTSSSGLFTETFQFRQKRVPDYRLLKRAYEGEIPIKPAKAKDNGKYVSSIDPKHRQYFEVLIQKYGNQGVNYLQNDDSDSEVWDSD